MYSLTFHDLFPQFHNMLRVFRFLSLGWACYDAAPPVQRAHSSSPGSASSPDSISDGDSLDILIDPSEIDLGSLAITATKPHNEALYEVLDMDASIKLRSQVLFDELYRTYHPEMEKDDHYTTLTQSTPFGNLTLATAVYKGYSSVVFGVKGHPLLIIKYEVQCADFEFELHPILRDGWYMQEASEAGIAPKALFVSPPSFLCEGKVGKCKFFRMSRERLNRCKMENGIVRYVIMERVNGKTLEELRTSSYGNSNGAMSLHNAAQITKKLVQILRVLHEDKKVVHGDIHTSNVMFVEDWPPRLLLVDFGRAFRLRTNLSESPGLERHQWNQIMNTQWQIDGYEWAARDDLNKAIQLFAHLMNPREYHTLESKLEARGVPTMRVWKESADWFVTIFHDPVEVLVDVSASSKFEIKRVLRRILETVRNLRINGPLPYYSLIKDLGMIADLSISKTDTAQTNATTATSTLR